MNQTLGLVRVKWWKYWSCTELSVSIASKNKIINLYTYQVIPGMNDQTKGKTIEVSQYMKITKQCCPAETKEKNSKNSNGEAD